MARILLCDDATFVRQTIAKILMTTEHEVVGEASNGKECIQQYKLCKPDIVMMDITMPDMDGIEATKQIVALDEHAKIIMVSAMGQQEKVFAAIAAGAKDFIVKPFEPSKIISCIGKYI